MIFHAALRLCWRAGLRVEKTVGAIDLRGFQSEAGMGGLAGGSSQRCPTRRLRSRSPGAKGRSGVDANAQS